ncbi:hypothetical protein [Amycolatopsis sp. CA-230715]|uniref:hypothetical protein n=1 Tax=Amycolatopsis sp. CA-230715 TaxID=2745196 RepID=UPI001C02B155|nr:hypothetical protein [Amycolatopsis sp. CA-230715]QWF84694.1 hypothetical protein HUW46_08146 [Amycolatopsis sp. CA-230715]
MIDGVDDHGWVDAFALARGEAERAWADDEKLDSTVTLPWATLPGRIALDAYTHEERSGHGPFGPIAPVAEDADVYTRLAAYLGRRP